MHIQNATLETEPISLATWDIPVSSSQNCPTTRLELAKVLSDFGHAGHLCKNTNDKIQNALSQKCPEEKNSKTDVYFRTMKKFSRTCQVFYNTTPNLHSLILMCATVTNYTTSSYKYADLFPSQKPPTLPVQANAASSNRLQSLQPVLLENNNCKSRNHWVDST